jgi:xanthine dehydrogenase iron-sulfur cluster and FAD-binding subunit A
MHEVQQHHQRPTRHVLPVTLAGALELLSQYGPTARPMAGGTDLLLQISRGAVKGVDVLVDLSHVPDLNLIDLVGDTLRIGALVTHNDIIASPIVVERALPLAQASLELGAPALRNRATVVGNVVTASPANDTISALWALDATVVIASLTGERRVRLREFYPGIRRTVLQPGELVTHIEVPVLSSTKRGVWAKLGQRRAQAISIVHLGVVLDFDGDIVTSASLALGSVAATIVGAPAAEAALIGQPLSHDTIADAARRVAEQVTPISDVRATAAYRSEEVTVLVRRALTTLLCGSERQNWPTAPRFLRGEVVTIRPRRTLSFTDTTEVWCSLNGATAAASHAAGETLLDWLRDQHHLTGTKEGCAEGECGACTVHLDGQAVLSCLVPAPRAQGADITTIEGLNGSTPNALQQAFVDQFAVQCGYCIPGFVMAADRLLAECPTPTRDDIASGLSGNLCRCTGYYRFYEAVEQAARV